MHSNACLVPRYAVIRICPDLRNPELAECVCTRTRLENRDTDGPLPSLERDVSQLPCNTLERCPNAVRIRIAPSAARRGSRVDDVARAPIDERRRE